MDVAVDLVVPVKELRRAKSRLAPAVADLPGDDVDREQAHRALALALARDTLRAARAAGRVGRLVVVTAEPAGRLGAAGEPRELVPDEGGGLNAAVLRGAAHLYRPGARAVAALQADLPALRPEELDDALARASALFAGGVDAAFVADHDGTGTTLLIAAPGRSLWPRFGPGSARAHARSGAVALDGDWPGLRGDVDTAADLARARALGTGPATSAWSDDHAPVADHAPAPGGY
ncbi:2-phospho-L-lactate guanylyltransferase [Actinomycetospora lemnae]|uniref:Phosphoenolpyruvate guanylyltransferase n=1 Tax=Actinomycetospora lemnae TaxID=3019891 RepID=A0ABT5SNQ1_9PSEU|nr:2-phospho-L-lactate guanylyltransferase [Actinomycetospora sp. DW7H6]MDD7964414.1 2-phospho-L-lactate guanylyltransferase [Actinomycetospora sp. DW7H6]